MRSTRGVLLTVAVVCLVSVSTTRGQFEKQGVCEMLARKVNQKVGKGVGGQLGTIREAHAPPLQDRLEADYEERGVKAFLWPDGEFPPDKASFARYLSVASPDRLARLRDRAQLTIKHTESADPSERAAVSEADGEVIRTQGAARLRLYGDLLLAEALLQGGRLTEAAKVAAEARARGDLGSLPRTGPDTSKGGPLTTEELACRLAAVEVQAGLDNLPREPKDVLTLLGQTLDQADAVLPFLARPDGVKSLLEAVGRIELDSLVPPGAAAWQQTEALGKLGPLIGLAREEGGVTLFLQREQLHGLQVTRRGKLTILTGEDTYTHFRRLVAAEMERSKDRPMTLFNVSRRWGETVVTLAGNREDIVLRKEDEEKIVRGEPLPADHPLTLAVEASREKPLVLFSNPLMRRDGAALREADVFAFALQRCYPEVPIFRDPPSDNTARRAAEVRDLELSAPSDLAAVIPKESFDDPARFSAPRDGKLIQNIEDDLAEAGVRISRFDPTIGGWDGGTEKALLVITGHIDERLVKYVHALGEAGAFKDKLVVLTTCQLDESGRPGTTRQLIGEISERYGARGVFGYEGIIRVNQLEPFFLELAERIKAVRRDGKGVNFDRLFRSTLRKFGLNGVWTICRAAADPRRDRFTS